MCYECYLYLTIFYPDKYLLIFLLRVLIKIMRILKYLQIIKLMDFSTGIKSDLG